jgi:hypothetical protein
VSRF